MKKIDSIINCNDYRKADSIILTVGYDSTSTLLKGACKCGLAVVKCLHEDVEFFDRFSLTEPTSLFKIAHRNLGIINRLSPEQMVQVVSNEYCKLLNNRQFLMLLGGDHSVSIGAFKAIATKYNPSEITIFQIDAHCDLRNDDSKDNPNQNCTSKYGHSSVMRRAFEMGFNIVQVGIRSFSKEEWDFIKENNITIFEWGKNKIPSINSIISKIKTKSVYLSIDADGIDPSHMPSVGTPVPGGLEWYYTLKLLNAINKSKEIIAADIVEVVPRTNEVLTQFAAAQLCYMLISNVLLKKSRIT